MKTNFLWAISKCGVKYFEQSAMDLRLWLLRAHYSWISWLMVMHLLQSLLCLACFYETKFLWLFPNAEWNTLSSVLWIFICNSSKHKKLSLVADGYFWKSYFALAKVSVFSNLPKCSAKWCYVLYFQCLEICMQICSMNVRKFTQSDSPRGFSFSDHRKHYSVSSWHALKFFAWTEMVGDLLQCN